MYMNFSYKQIWLIAYPILISLLMEHMINVTDTAFLGHVGEVELGASALAGVLYMAIYMLGFGFSIGVQILIARRNGEQKYGEIGGIFMQGAFFLLALATVMFFLCDYITTHILGRLISSDQVYAAAASYLECRRYGLFFSFIAILFRAFYIGITETRTLTLNSVVMVLSNVVFNYILIFGKFGFPALGIAGAAIGSSLAELVSLLFYVVYTWLKVDKKKYALFQRFAFRLSEFKRIWSISCWTMLQSILFPSQWFLFFIAIEHLGERSLAIANIMRSINTCFFMVIFAFADTASSMVSNLLGSGKDKSEIRLACRRAIKLTYLIGIPFLLLSALFPSVLLQIYTNNEELVQAALPTTYVMLVGYFLSAPGLVLFNAVSGTGNTNQSMRIMLMTIAVYVVYVVIMVMYFKVDVAVAWTSEYIYGGMLLLLSYFYLKNRDWNKRI
ncbi:MATE family efflux transporter [uncultured Bacteroides sp.]|nr:MATE family efflux transporter [uncultured Bacteroides sp.]